MRVLISSTLALVYAVNRVVAWDQKSDDCAYTSPDSGANRGHSTSTNHINAVGARAFGFRRTYPGTYSCAHYSADYDVAQMVFVFHESYFANVLLGDGLSACRVLVRDRCLGETHENSGMLRRVHCNDLNLLPRTQGAEIRP